jgi:HAMP domain-containing protein
MLGPASHWPFVLAAYGLVFGVLLAYWRRVERGIRALERGTGGRPAGRPS